MIQQTKFSDAVKFFQPGFQQRWNLKTYDDPLQSCFFGGVYSQEDVDIINAHQGLAVVWNTGKTMDCFSNIKKSVVVMRGNGVTFDLGGYKVKDHNMEIKDYSPFKPNLLGDAVYCYIGFAGQDDKYYKADVDSLYLPFKIIWGRQGFNMDHVKREYYDRCFINIKLSPTGGITSATELAFMGRKTVSNTVLPFCMGYENKDQIKEIIMEESKKIGTLQPSCADGFFDNSDKWLNENFWL